MTFEEWLVSQRSFYPDRLEIAAMRRAWTAARALPPEGREQEPVLGECEECGHTIVTPLRRFNEEQQAMVENATEAKVATTADTKDAARYRWLRDDSIGQFDHPIVVSQKRIDRGMQYIGPMMGKPLDEAIDHARALQSLRQMPETSCETHGRLESKDGKCPKC